MLGFALKINMDLKQEKVREITRLWQPISLIKQKEKLINLIRIINNSQRSSIINTADDTALVIELQYHTILVSYIRSVLVVNHVKCSQEAINVTYKTVYNTDRYQLLHGLVVRIPGFHAGGPGSIPGVGIFFYLVFFFFLDRSY